MSIMFVFSSYYLIVNVVLETNKQFLPGKGQNLFQNLFVIIAALFFYKKIGMVALLFAFVLAGIVQCGQITWSARKVFRLKISNHSENESIKKLLLLSAPLIVGNAIYEINDIVDKQIASGLGAGGVSVLSYGASINEIVTTLIVSSVSTVLFSHYATWIAEGKQEKVGNNLKLSLEYLIVLIMPVMIMCFVCGDCIVDILYGRGNFGADSIERTSGVVMGYAVGFFFQAARANIVKVYYAFQDTRTPMINGAISVGANIAMSLALARIMGAAGVALATSLAMLLVTLLLFPQIKKHLPTFSMTSSFPEYIKAIAAAVAVGIAANFLRHLLRMSSLFTFIVVGCFTVACYTLLIVCFKVNCVQVIVSKFAGVIRR